MGHRTNNLDSEFLPKRQLTIPNLAAIRETFLDLIKKSGFEWRDTQSTAFVKLKEIVIDFVRNHRFDLNKITRVKGGSSKQHLGRPCGKTVS